MKKGHQPGTTGTGRRGKGKATERKPDRKELASRAPLERMMRIHAAIRDGHHPNASRLSTDLEVSSKTIQRDLEFMRDRLGLPLEYDSRQFGYVYTEPVEAFPTLQISEGELFALLVAEKALQQYRGTPFEGRLEGALRKLAQALPGTVTLNLADWESSVSFRTTAEPVVNLPLMDFLAEAIRDCRQIRMQYRKPGQARAEERVVDPCHLANVNGDWYLFALDRQRGELRTFVPSRIQSATRTGRRFSRPPPDVLENRLRDSFGIHSREGDFEVRIRFEASVADYIREKRWHASQRLEELPEGGVRLHLRLGSLVEILRWVLGWGGNARVETPEELRRMARQAGRRLLEAHGEDASGPERGGMPDVPEA